MRWSLTLPCALGAALLASWSGSASANMAYPPALKTDLALQYTPPCTICHQNGTPTFGNSNSPFSLAMKTRGLSQNGDITTIPPAIAKMKADKVDSNGDGTTDIDALIGGLDPSTGATLYSSGTGGGGTAAVPIEVYGCGAHVAPGNGSDAAPFAALVVVGLGLAAARRRARR